MGAKGYLGFGYDNNITTFFNDFWEWDQATNSWSQKASLPCNPRHYAVSFSIATKGYVGLGEGSGLNILHDFWEFDPNINSWEQKANFGGGKRNIGCGFSNSAKGYVGTGLFSVGFKDFWEYDSLSLAISAIAAPCVSTVNFSSNISGADSYLWNFGDGSTSTLTSPAKTYIADGNYSVMLVVFWSCSSDTAYQSISVNSSFVTVRNFSICQGDSLFLQGDYQVSSGTYFDTLASVNGCDSIISSTVHIAGAVFSGYDTTIDLGTTIELYAGPGANYLWNTGATSPNISVSPQENSTFTVTITDAIGCSDTALFKVFINDSHQTISVPNVFSPNSDGINDFIKVHGYGVKEYILVIYDRWGERIFEDTGTLIAHGTGAPWDGSFKGKPLNSSIFVYILDAVFIDGTEFHEKGNITLLK